MEILGLPWYFYVMVAVLLAISIAIGGKSYVKESDGNGDDIKITGTVTRIVPGRITYGNRVTFWLVRAEGSNRKVIIFFNRSRSDFRDLPAKFKRGDRVEVTGGEAEVDMESDAEMSLLADIGSEAHVVSVIVAKGVEKLEPMYVAASKETGPAAQVLQEVKGDPRGELMLVASRLEHAVKSRVNESFPESKEFIDSMSVSQLYKFGVTVQPDFISTQ